MVVFTSMNGLMIEEDNKSKVKPEPCRTLQEQTFTNNDQQLFTGFYFVVL